MPVVAKLVPVANPLNPVMAAKDADVPAARLSVAGVAFGQMVGVNVELAFKPVESVTT